MLNIKALGNNQKWQIMKFVSCYVVSLSRFLTKTAKICRYSQCLHSLFTQLWDAIFYLFEVGKWNNHEVALSMGFLRVPLFTLISCYLLLHLLFCKAYENCLVLLIKITTVLGVPKNVTYKNLEISKFKMVNISKQDIGTSFKSAHTACQSSILAHALNLKFWKLGFK